MSVSEYSACKDSNVFRDGSDTVKVRVFVAIEEYNARIVMQVEKSII